MLTAGRQTGRQTDRQTVDRQNYIQKPGHCPRRCRRRRGLQRTRHRTALRYQARPERKYTYVSFMMYMYVSFYMLGKSNYVIRMCICASMRICLGKLCVSSRVRVCMCVEMRIRNLRLMYVCMYMHVCMMYANTKIYGKYHAWV